MFCPSTTFWNTSVESRDTIFPHAGGGPFPVRVAENVGDANRSLRRNARAKPPTLHPGLARIRQRAAVTPTVSDLIPPPQTSSTLPSTPPRGQAFPPSTPPPILLLPESVRHHNTCHRRILRPPTLNAESGPHLHGLRRRALLYDLYARPRAFAGTSPKAPKEARNILPEKKFRSTHLISVVSA